MSVTQEQVIEYIKGISVVELSQLVKALEVELGVSARPDRPFIVDEVPTILGIEDKTSFDIMLTSYGTTKINVIKVVRELTGLGLKEAKDFVEAVPKLIPLDLDSKEKAEKIKKLLEDAGASVEII